MKRAQFTLLAFALAACAGAGPAVESAAGASGAASTGSAPAEEAKADPKRKAFELKDADKSSRARGKRASKIKATKTDAAVRFVVVEKGKAPMRGLVISLKAPDGTKYFTGETDAAGYAEVLVPIGETYDLEYLSLGKSKISAQVKVSDKPRLNLNLRLRYEPWKPKPAEVTTLRRDPPSAPPRFVLMGVQFDTGKATIRPDSVGRLDSVVEYMTHKKSARIEISGHTDNVGKPKTNKKLSTKRAEAVRDFLTSKGIAAARIVALGHGAAYPIASNDTAGGREKNRRIEAHELVD